MLKEIYHLTIESSFKNQIMNSMYTPIGFSKDKFIHCTDTIDLTLVVANKYLLAEKDILVLKINQTLVQAKVFYEESNSFAMDKMERIFFPHIFGALNIDAITEIGKLRKENGAFFFPKFFYSFNDFLEKEIKWN